MRRSATIAAAMLCCSLRTVLGAEATAVPIVIGGAPVAAACPSGGAVTGLDLQGDNFLSVRSGPGGQGFREVDRVFTGMHLTICDMVGPWFGVVYSARNNPMNCDVDRPWINRKVYTGPCRQGWVYSRYVALTGKL